MAKNPKQKLSLQSKKHLARLERERLYRRYIMIGSLVVLITVIALVGYGILNETVLKSLRPVATVNGEKIAAKDFYAQVRYARSRLVNTAINEYQFIQFLGNNPDTMYSFASDLARIQNDLTPTNIGQQVLDTMIDDALIRQEAERRGITVSEAEIERAIQEALGYFPNGTPTPEPSLVPIPTSTLSPLQMTLVPPTATPTATAIPTPTSTPTITLPTATPSQVPTITPTLAPTPTATEYTLQGFQKLYQDTLNSLKTAINFSEKDLRYVITAQLYRQKVEKAVLDELGVSREEEQVWARHILVADEAKAKEILDQLNKGGDWCKLAAENSIDTSNKDNCGDLGWFGKGRMVPEFEQAAFALQPGEISQPVKTSFGYHIIQVLGHENRPLDDNAYQQARQDKFQQWLKDQRDKAKIVINDKWTEDVPTEPQLPQEITSFIQQAQQQAFPTAAPITPEPTTVPTP